jgi:phosphoribosylaminoimidazole-succinocarboxamide synthase
MLVKRAEVVPVECVVRGYITGSLWKEYLEARKKRIFGPNRILVQGHWFPGNLKESEELPLSIFTPSTKAQTGHDVNLDYGGMVEYLSRWLEKKPEIKRYFEVNLLAQALRSTSLALYLVARNYARQCGIIIADTKFEFGFIDNQLYLIDEILTPDSSRFWDSKKYEPGGPQASYDKQYLRDWLIESGWNKEPPAPELPEEIVIATTERYQEAYRRLTGCK